MPNGRHLLCMPMMLPADMEYALQPMPWLPLCCAARHSAEAPSMQGGVPVQMLFTYVFCFFFGGGIAR